jgi:hypothetical protein
MPDAGRLFSNNLPYVKTQVYLATITQLPPNILPVITPFSSSVHAWDNEG